MAGGRLAYAVTGAVVDGVAEGTAASAPHVVSLLARQQQAERSAGETSQPIQASSKSLAYRGLAPTSAGSTVDGQEEGSVPRKSSPGDQHPTAVRSRVIAKRGWHESSKPVELGGAGLQSLCSHSQMNSGDKERQRELLWQKREAMKRYCNSGNCYGRWQSSREGARAF